METRLPPVSPDTCTGSSQTTTQFRIILASTILTIKLKKICATATHFLI